MPRYAALSRRKEEIGLLSFGFSNCYFGHAVLKSTYNDKMRREASRGFRRPVLKRAAAILILVLLLAFGGAAYAVTGGGAGDPLISLSFLQGTFVGDLLTQARTKADTQLGEILDDAEKRLTYLEPEDPSGTDYSGEFAPLAMSTGGWVELSQFASFVPSYGSLAATVKSGSLIDLTDGSEYFGTAVLTAGRRYFAAEASTVRITAYSDAYGLVDGYYEYSATGTLPQGALFIDLDGHWAKTSVLYMADRGYVNGVGSFRFAPDDAVTRSMFVTVLGRVAGVNTSMYRTSSFKDVDMSSWYGPYVAWAASLGIVTGYNNETFGPDDLITREQMALILDRFMTRYSWYVYAANAPVTFTDNDRISSWAADAVRKMQTMGIINGVDVSGGTAFLPTDTANRGQMCAVLERLLILSGRG